MSILPLADVAFGPGPREIDPATVGLLGCLGLAVLGIAILVVERLVPLHGGGDVEYAMRSRRGVRLGGWFLILMGLFVAGMIGVVPIIILIIVGMAVQRDRRARSHSLLWTLTVAAERGLPLAPAVRAMGQETGWYAGRGPRLLATLLENGVPLPDALDQLGGPISPEDRLAIRVGCECNALAPALRRTLGRLEGEALVWRETWEGLAYLSVVLSIAAGVVAFMVMKIVPAFQKIFAEFGASLPTVTKVVFSLSRPGEWLLPLAECGLFILLGYAVLRYVGVVEWNLIGFRWLARRHDRAAVLDALAIAVETGRPLPNTLAAFGMRYPRSGVRRRMAATLSDLIAGRPWIEALCRHGVVGRAERAVLEAAERAGNLAWALRAMAEHNRRRLIQQLYTAGQVLFPAALLAVAAAIGTFIVACFLPLIALISALAKNPP